MQDGHQNNHRNSRIYHWIIVGVFITMLTTGTIFLLPAFSTIAAGGWSRVVHRIGATLLVTVPVIFALTNRSSVKYWFTSAAFWTKRSIALNPDRRKGQHRFLISSGFTIFVTTGILKWLLRDYISPDVFQTARLIHDIAFFSAILVIIYHVYHELVWWLWKKRYCERCPAAFCAAICPTNAIETLPGGGIIRHPVRCINCRLCMWDCRQNKYYPQKR
jgi:ferredoxin